MSNLAFFERRIPSNAQTTESNAVSASALEHNAPEMNLALQRRFHKSIPERRQLLLDQWTKCRKNPSDSEPRLNLIQSLHTLGEAALACGARAIVAAVKSVESALPHALNSDFTLLEPQVDELLDACAAAALSDAVQAQRNTAAIWVSPYSHSMFDWLSDLLGVSGYRVQMMNSFDENEITDALCHVAIIALDTTPDPLNFVNQLQTKFKNSGRPWCIFVLCERHDYEWRRALFDGISVLPSSCERSQLLKAIEAKINSMMEPPPRVTLLTQNPKTAALWSEQMITVGIDIHLVSRVEDVWHTVYTRQSDALLLDYEQNLDTLISLSRVVRQNDIGQNIPILIHGLPHHAHETSALLANGAEPIYSDTSPALSCQCLAQRIRRQKHSSYNHAIDPLTGAMARLAFALGLQNLLDASAPFVAVGIVNVDGLRKLNLQKGREAGDRALREITQRLRSSMPPSGILGRQGGEDFLIAISARTEAEGRRILAHISQPGFDQEPSEERLDHRIAAYLLDRSDRAHRPPLAQILARTEDLLIDGKSKSTARLFVSCWKQ